MKEEKPDIRTVFRYIVLQVPGTIAALLAAIFLIHYTSLSPWIIWTGFGTWVLKDVVIFFLAWPSYRPAEGKDPMVGRKGRVVSSCRPEGTVEIHGTLWKAVSEDREQALAPGTMIRVCGRDRLTLIVKPAHGDR